MASSKNTDSSADRVRLHRWANKVEEAADQLLELLDSAPDPLPRKLVFDPRLIATLSAFSIGMDDATEEDYPHVRFLELGNGHQVANKRKALAYTAQVLEGATIVDRRTVDVAPWGRCHFAAYTHPKGAMISTPHKGDDLYGSADWHSRDHLILFRDVGDGRCVIYVCPIEPLFGLRTIGHHGVTWGNIKKTAVFSKTVASQDARDAMAAQQ